MYEAYLDFCRDRGIGRTAVGKAFWRKLKSLVTTITEFRAHRDLGQARMVQFPPLEESRAQFVGALHESSWEREDKNNHFLFGSGDAPQADL